MKRHLACAVFALSLTGIAAFAGGYADTIRQAYESAGYSNVEVRQVNGQWLVTAEKAGGQFHFIVDPGTGQAVKVADNSPDAALFDDGATGSGTDSGSDSGSNGGLIKGRVQGDISGHNTGRSSGGDDDAGGEHSGGEHSGGDDNGGESESHSGPDSDD